MRRRIEPGAGDGVRDREGRQDEVRLEELGLEPEADEHAGEREPAEPVALERPDERVGGPDEQQREQGVGVVVAEDQDRGRGERGDEAGDDRGGRAERAAHRGHQQRRPWRRPSAPAAAGSSAELSPNSRTDRPITIVASGGLSTVMKLAGSMEPMNQADQLCDAAQAAPE